MKMKTRKELLREIEQLKMAICQAEENLVITEGVDLWYAALSPSAEWVAVIKEVTKDCEYRLDRA